MPNTTDTCDVAVVGAGPAGLTAATYLCRFLRDCVVIDAGNSRAKWIPESHNCPGFPSGVSGSELLRRMREQAMDCGTRFEAAEVEHIAAPSDPDGIFVLASGTRQWQARCVILATGIVDKLPGAPWISDAVACGAIRLCAVCDAFEARDSCIGVYGPARDIGAHGLFLRAYSDRVYLLPSDDADGGEDVRRAVDAGVQLLAPGVALEFDGHHCRSTSADGTRLVFDALYPFLGGSTAARLAVAAGATLSDSGEIIVDRDQMTAQRGLFAIGDVVSGLNQIAVAVGHAAIAATRINALLPMAPR
ncbi:NAD(P)/FAD-dependent oxidoreductase [Thermomonas fusca]|uniref:NAD(P)/FAD-dependent oxidoreductase n=1 Tax=Thermomonas fusca TaxID=215690 RepID=A0A5R9PFB7_9GAMM|nr:NAD(P)/FAD-dependent oxidoreductase [Thermomonas fusca]TLX22214.1 NAD(P)/FAD-dependent oxidoreductase [Thermomonas fusca]